MITASVIFGDQTNEVRLLDEMPGIGSLVCGPNHDATTWKVTATVRNTDGSAAIYCKPTPQPAMIYGVPRRELGLIEP